MYCPLLSLCHAFFPQRLSYIYPLYAAFSSRTSLGGPVAVAIDKHNSITSIHILKGIIKTYNIFLREPKIIKLINKNLIFFINK